MVTGEGIQFQLNGRNVELSFSSKLEKIRLDQISEYIHSKISVNNIFSDSSGGVKFQKDKIIHRWSLILTKKSLLM
jgi:hypothetical protein